MQGVVSGACCVTALIEGQEMVVSNLGDCRAVLCRGGVAEVLTKDHRAEQEDERKRIENKVFIIPKLNLMRSFSRKALDNDIMFIDTGRIC